MPRRRKSRRDHLDDEVDRELIDEREAGDEERAPRRRRSKGRWRRNLIMAGSLGLVFLFLLPNLIGWTGLHQALVNRAISGTGISVAVQGASLGWLQPVALTGIEVTGRDRKPLLSAASITTSASLGAIAWSRNPGTIMIRQPVVNAELREGGSNLEDVLAAFDSGPDSPDQEPATLPPLQIVVSDGQVNLTDGVTTSRLAPVNADLRTASGEAALCLEASLGNSAEQAGGTLELSALIDEGASSLDLNQARAKLVAGAFDLADLGPVLTRLCGAGQTGGQLNGTIECAYAGEKGEWSVDLKQASLQSLRFASQRLLGADLLELERVVAGGQATLSTGGLSARQLEVSADVGTLRADGSLPWSDLSKLLAEGRLAAAPFRLDGRIDLARLGALLPATLGLHRDLQFESGELVLNVAGGQENGTPRLVANLDTVNLAARRGGQRIAWQQPLRLVTTIAQRNGQLAIDDLQCESDFLQLRGSGTLAEARFDATADLQLMLERLRQFAALDGWQLSGKLQGQLACRAESVDQRVAQSASELLGRPIQLAADMTIEQPLIQMPGVAAWSEPQLRLVANATAQAGGDGRLGIAQGLAQVHLGTDSATFQLAQPMPDLLTVRGVTGDLACKGRLGRWLGLVRNFVDIGSFTADGDGTIAASVQATPQLVRATGLQYQFSQFAFDGYGMSIREDQVSGAGGVDYDFAASKITARNLTLVSSSVAALADEASLAIGDKLVAAGNIGLRGDVHRIAGWFGLSDPGDTVQYFGNLEGNIALGSHDELMTAGIRAAITDLVAARPDPAAGKWVELLREPRADVQGTLGLAPSFNDLRISALQLAAGSVSAQIDGTVRNLAGTFDMDLNGNWSPDWQQVNGLVAAYTGDMVQLAGKSAQRFAIKGPLFADPAAGGPANAILPAATQVATELQWDQGQVFLLPVGPARIEAQLAGSVARLNTGAIPFGNGTVTVRPEIDLSAAAPVVRIAPGDLMQNVQLTPAFCRDWMKYVAPLLADVTTAEGSFSVKSGEILVPLDNCQNATARGAVTLHNVTVGAGPLAQQLLETVDSVRTMLKPGSTSKDRSVWMQLGQQEIPFAVEGGRVYHEGLKLQVKDLAVTTRGSVGFDQSLQMVAAIPVHDDWIAGERWLEGLRGQWIEIPVSGTVSRPVLDRRAIQQLSTQLLQRTAQNELNRVVGDQAQKLQEKAATQINGFQQQLQDKLKNEVGDKVPGDLLKGIDSLFGPRNSTPPSGTPATGSGGTSAPSGG